MIPHTYRYGYGSTRLTLLRMRQQSGVAPIDPELWRRLKHLMRDARKAGHDIGIGGAARSAAQQTALFLSRHNQVPSGGCCMLAGKYYALKSGAAHAAPPGRSYHEPSSPTGGVLAVDLVGWETPWLEPNLARYGLRSIPSERWHIQPKEIATARSQYRGPHPLPKWRFA
jgi:hypothetical protein